MINWPSINIGINARARNDASCRAHVHHVYTYFFILFFPFFFFFFITIFWFVSVAIHNPWCPSGWVKPSECDDLPRPNTHYNICSRFTTEHTHEYTIFFFFNFLFSFPHYFIYTFQLTTFFISVFFFFLIHCSFILRDYAILHVWWIRVWNTIKIGISIVVCPVESHGHFSIVCK